MIISNDIKGLHANAPEQLRKLGEKYNLNKVTTSTVYHFGYSEEEQVFKGYVYRSSNFFEPEDLPLNGFGVKPQVDYEPLQEIRDIQDIADKFIEIIQKQRTEDLDRPIEERVGIGGEIYLLVMFPGLTSITRIYRFDDYMELGQGMCSNL